MEPSYYDDDEVSLVKIDIFINMKGMRRNIYVTELPLICVSELTQGHCVDLR